MHHRCCNCILSRCGGSAGVGGGRLTSQCSMVTLSNGVGPTVRCVTRNCGGYADVRSDVRTRHGLRKFVTTCLGRDNCCCVVRRVRLGNNCYSLAVVPSLAHFPRITRTCLLRLGCLGSNSASRRNVGTLRRTGTRLSRCTRSTELPGLVDNGPVRGVTVVCGNGSL